MLRSRYVKADSFEIAVGIVPNSRLPWRSRLDNVVTEVNTVQLEAAIPFDARDKVLPTKTTHAVQFGNRITDQFRGKVLQ